ncbi:radial spoke head 1 homolog [Dendronephthya gigantea]|uniref:radial spoke head 1 homolog n=1 Tax=Dendronephthya gigantea TaxID=151771 RepID=UPI00106CB56E|nr:radial spoke head 1 homolog [Dendronephthya gigantea]
MSSSDESGSDVIEDLGEYVGERNEAGERHGVGKAQLKNGDIYDGSYKYGRRDGPGMYFFIANNAKYDGTYKEGERHGHGTMIYPDGSKYEGTWDHNKRQGYGIYHYANGDKYEGEWLNDQKHGQGVYDYRHAQTKFTGMWNMGKQEGMGTVEYPQMKFRGFFHIGYPIGIGKFVFNRGYEQKGIYITEEHERIVDSDIVTEKTSHWTSDGGIVETQTGREPFTAEPVVPNKPSSPT